MDAHRLPLPDNGPTVGPPGWRAAAVGLSPAAIGVMLAVVMVCALSIALGNVLRAGSAAPFWRQAGLIFVLLLATTTPIVLAVLAAVGLAPPSGWRRVAVLIAAVLLGVVAGFLLRIVVARALGLPTMGPAVQAQMLFVAPRFLLLGVMLAVALEFYRLAERSARAARQAELDRVALERDWIESQLHALRAQIEPHFLFNTLAHVRRLFETDAASARSMLDSLMHYLEVALPHMRQDESTLEHEASLAEAYLQIQQIRMGRRLRFSVDIPAALRRQALPPMMLLTLVENAVKHGIQPARQGGDIKVSARLEGERWLLAVADSGAGFSPGSGSGTGLANIRARLAAQFGGRAALDLQLNDLGGVTATLALPS